MAVLERPELLGLLSKLGLQALSSVLLGSQVNLQKGCSGTGSCSEMAQIQGTVVFSGRRPGEESVL